MALGSPDIDWRFTARNAQVMPTRLVSQPPFGEFWLSAIDPVLNAQWLQQTKVRGGTKL